MSRSSSCRRSGWTFEWNMQDIRLNAWYMIHPHFLAAGTAISMELSWVIITFQAQGLALTDQETCFPAKFSIIDSLRVVQDQNFLPWSSSQHKKIAFNSHELSPPPFEKPVLPSLPKMWFDFILLWIKYKSQEINHNRNSAVYCHLKNEEYNFIKGVFSVFLW